jgi:hypothetical protein
MFSDLKLRHWLFLVLGCALGLALGVFITWQVWPVVYYDTDPVDLRSEHKDDYVVMVAAAYAQDGDLELAVLRLDGLGFEDAKQVVVGLFQRHREAGYVGESHTLAVLAYDLGVEDVALLPYIEGPTATPQIVASPTIAATLEATALPTPTEPVPEPTVTATEPPPEASPTPTETPEPPTPTPTEPPTEDTPTPLPTGEFDFQLVEQEDLGCSSEGAGDYILVYVQDEEDRGLAGVQIMVVGPEGEDLFFTGMKPEVDSGFADFRVATAGTYTVQVVDGTGQIAEGLTFDDGCPADNPYHSWRVTFRRVSQ